MPVPRPEGGRALAIDKKSAAVVREAVRRVIAGESVNSIVADFNRRKIPTPSNHERLRAARPLETRGGVNTNGAVWRQRTLIRLLRSPVILDHTLQKRQAVSRDDGSTWPAVITLVEWDQRRRDYRNGLPAGTDNSEKIAIVRRSLESIRAEYERGEYHYPGGEADYQARKGRLSLPR